MKKLSFVIFLLLFVSQTSFAQLSNFVLSLEKTDESCTGNGSLTFNVSNTTPGSTIIYRIYKLPDTVNSIAVLSTNTFGGLAAGTYRVIATQTLGADSGTQQQDITIFDTRTVVTYDLSSTQINCNTGTIDVSVLTGNPVTYEIISGPVTVPPQVSPTFTNLHAGTYNIRVNDACGEGVVQTYTLTFANPPNLTIADHQTSCRLSTCNTIPVSFVVFSNDASPIRFPLTVEITILPPSGAPIVHTQIITSGNPLTTVSDIIPFYHAQLYSFNIRIVDACGNIYIKDGNQIMEQLSVSAQETYSHCIKGFSMTLCNFVPPYNVSFLSAPAGFNPSTFNGTHPGPFTAATIYYTSPSLTNLVPNGDYTIQVTDACNRTAVAHVTVQDHEPDYRIILPDNVCDNRYLQIPREPGMGPLIVSAVFTAATGNLGSPIPYDVSGNIVDGVLFMPLPPGTYTIQGVDECGNPYIYTIIIPPIIFEVRITPNNVVGCTGAPGSALIEALNGSLLSSIVVTQAPTTYNHTLPYTVFSLTPPDGIVAFTVTGLPPGDYVLQLTDTCGNFILRNVTIAVNVSMQPLYFNEKRGCGDHLDSISLASPNGGLLTVIITAAPPSFPFTLPYDVSFNIESPSRVFYMNSFPEGSYTFYTKDICNVERTTTYALTGYHQGGTIEAIGNCGSFDLNMNFAENTNPGQGTSFWLQKFDPVTNQWKHPLTGFVYPPGTIPNTLNSYVLNNSAINYNIATTGTFRILMMFNYFTNASQGVGLSTCVPTIKEFEYTGELKIISAYAIPCINGGSQVFIITNGTPPLDYRITTKDDLPFLVNNGTSNSFSGLQPGTYNFRVQDICGNIVNRLLDINTLQEPEIASSNLCNGLNGQLSVQPFSFLNYEWWRGNDTTTILSTTNTLTFTPFTNASAGVYHVRIFSTTTNSCVDRILTYTISPTALPNAGLDGTKIICNSASNINLFSILNAPFDAGGTWEEITSSGGTLVGSNWLTTGVPLGTYIFKYTVNGFCDSVDDATVTVTLNSAVDPPIVNVNSPYCPGENLEFSILPISNVVYEWSGPNNFSSALPNPTITAATADNAGTYTVKATLDQCEATSTVTVVSNPVPEYTYEKSCDNGIFRVEIIPTGQSPFDPNTATYAWTGPNNFSSTSNPLILTNQPVGDYNVVVTNSEGCFSPMTISIASTFCDFPNVITPGNDGFNDSFDLTNYDVELFQVFSRWGRLVYEESNYTKGWYGQNMCGGFLPDSTYYYFVKLRNGVEKHGWIFVGRG